VAPNLGLIAVSVTSMIFGVNQVDLFQVTLPMIRAGMLSKVVEAL
jgi:hypothetical protein